MLLNCDNPSCYATKACIILLAAAPRPDNLIDAQWGYTMHSGMEENYDPFEINMMQTERGQEFFRFWRRALDERVITATDASKQQTAGMNGRKRAKFDTTNAAAFARSPEHRADGS